MKCDPKTHTCQPAECYTNPDCLGEYPNLRCCDRDPSLPEEIRSKGEGKCYDKGETIGKGEWICDPGKWVKCDENNLGEKAEFNGKTYICTIENGNYKWVESKINPISYFLAQIINFFKSLFG